MESFTTQFEIELASFADVRFKFVCVLHAHYQPHLHIMLYDFMTGVSKE
jgi:hypothetical protein